MPQITLEAIADRQAELVTAQSTLAKMIEQLRAQSAITVFTLPEARIELKAGELFGGVVLNEEGAFSHNLILLPHKPAGHLAWQPAMDWAASVGGVLPTPQEQALLYANLKKHFEARWHWSSKTHEKDASYAWGCVFGYGGQSLTLKSYEGCARAVRRLPVNS